MHHYITSGDIKPTSKGFRVDKKAKGQPRLRKTFDTYDEAEIVLKKYLKGEADQIAITATNSLTWRDLYDNAVRRKWRKAKTATQQENAERAINKVLGWDSDVRQFDQKAADLFASEIEQLVPSLTTASRYFSAVRFMLSLGVEWGLITWKVPKLEHHTKSNNERINVFDYETEEKIINIMRQVDKPDEADLFVLLVETGMRTSEGQYLLWRDVDLDAGSIIVWGVDNKTDTTRKIELTERALTVLRMRRRDVLHARVFPSVTKSTRRSVWDSVRKALDNYDEDFIWYTTRHTCASRLMKAGVDVKTVQKMLGHSRIETTMRYVVFCEGSLSSAVSSLEALRQGGKAVTVDTNAVTVTTQEAELLRKLLENKDLLKSLLAA